MFGGIFRRKSKRGSFVCVSEANDIEEIYKTFIVRCDAEGLAVPKLVENVSVAVMLGLTT